MYRLLFTVSLLGFTHFAMAQINQMDEEGRKHGVWEKRYENGELQYKGQFDHGRPVNTFKRFYDDGSIQAVIEYERPDKNYATLYYPEVEIKMAEGQYLNQERDSVWLFYSEEGVLTSRETYREGLKEGLTEIFYTDGSVSERIMFKEDEKHGTWEQYFENGEPKLKATVVEGIKYEGKYTTYYPDGGKLQEGKYIDGKKESSWYHFNEDGSVNIIYVYRNDQLAEEHPKNGTFERYWPNDIKRSEYTYKNGVKHGPFEEWMNKGEWRNEERVDEYGNQYPVQKLYGTRLKRKGQYVNGELHGEIVSYSEDGSVKEITIYNMGKVMD